MEKSKTDRIFQKKEKKMSVQESWNDWKFFLLPFMIALPIGAGLILILQHDMAINNEHLYYSIYKGDKCESLLWDKSFEVRKYFPDQTELKVIDYYLKERNC